jgi:hypothetical protein
MTPRFPTYRLIVHMSSPGPWVFGASGTPTYVSVDPNNIKLYAIIYHMLKDIIKIFVSFLELKIYLVY